MYLFKSFNIICLGFLLSFSTEIFAQNAPLTLVMNGKTLVKNKQTILKGKDAMKKEALKNLLKEADKIVKIGKLYSVMDKKQVPPSGDKHDYMSQAPYWWPDSTKPNGLPYIRRDGERNPELNNISDHEEMGELINDVQTVALAYYFSKNQIYAVHGARLLKTWFLDASTHQNPNLNFGQGIPGINTGRGIGIIETRELYKLLDGAILLRGSKNWTNNNEKDLKKWFSEYLTWMIESPIGKDEADEHNNHGTYYDVQVMSFALFSDQPATAIKQLEVAKQRLASQLKEDGSQPHELARTVSWGYTNMNLYGFLTLARLAENFKADFWKYETSDGKSIKKAVDWLIPYIKKEKRWGYKQIKKMTWEDTVKILKIAAKAYADPTYDALAEKIDVKSYQSYMNQLIY